MFPIILMMLGTWK